MLFLPVNDEQKTQTFFHNSHYVPPFSHGPFLLLFIQGLLINFGIGQLRKSVYCNKQIESISYALGMIVRLKHPNNQQGWY